MIRDDNNDDNNEYKWGSAKNDKYIDDMANAYRTLLDIYGQQNTKPS